MTIRQVTSVNGGIPASRPILMNRNDEPQMRASERKRPQMTASPLGRACGVAGVGGWVTGVRPGARASMGRRGHLGLPSPASGGDRA